MVESSAWVPGSSVTIMSGRAGIGGGEFVGGGRRRLLNIIVCGLLGQ